MKKNKNIFAGNINYQYPGVMLKNKGNFWYASLYRNGEQVDFKRKLSAWSAFKKMIRLRNSLNRRAMSVKQDQER